MAEAADWERAIYAFVIGGEVKRIGSSKGKLGVRFKSWNRDVTATLCGKPKSTPPSEAEAWRDLLRRHGAGEVYARIATIVATPVDTFPAYMDEESVLLNRHRPEPNRHTNSRPGMRTADRL
jgi:hypothetical protein